MYSQQPRSNAAAHEYDAQYQPQSTDERLWDDGVVKQPVPRKPPNYKPTPLRWYFIVTLILSIMAIMALVVWAKLAMPDSDNSYTNQAHVRVRNGTVQKRSQQNHQAFEVAARAQQSPQPGTASEDPTATLGPDGLNGYIGTTTYVTSGTILVTQESTVKVFTTSVATTIFDVVTLSASEVENEPVVSTSWVPVTKTTHFVSNIVNTELPDTTEIVRTSYFTGWFTFPYTGSVMSSSSWSSAYEYTQTITLEPSAPATYQSTFESHVVSSSAIKITLPAVTEVQTGGVVTSAVATSSIEKVITTTQAPKTFITLGKVTITSIYTDPNYPKNHPPQNDPTQKPSVKTVQVLKTQSDTVFREVSRLGPVTRVSTFRGSVETIVATQAPPQTIVSEVGGHTTVVDVTTTGEDGLPTTKQVVSTVGGSLTTIAKQNRPETVVSEIGAYTTAVDVTTIGKDGMPTTKQVISTVGGSYTTLVDVVTTGEDGRPTTKQVSTVMSGRLTTFVISAEPATITSEISGYTTLVDVTTTGSDGLPTTTKVVSTVSGRLTTFLSTFKPTTFVTTHSGFTTTITSSRSGSTTFRSTKKGKTRTLESTTLITPTQTDSARPTDENVRKVEHVYSINDGTYFVGKFLPPFLSVMLSIPARIIDLNAQLYQPFYALNRPNGGLGPSSMTLHFGGWTGFLKPFTILAEGQPVTFFTMLIVWCSAIMTPVATEAIGVKIHGYCTPVDPTNCAAALGVSPTSTRALLALLALTVVLLCLLLLFLRNWETGLYANPWSVAGIASLATNREIRPTKNTERKMVKEMTDKRYGFGYFENDRGRTEYGIVLYDDAGRGLQATENPTGTLSEASSLDIQDIRRRKRRGNPFIALGVWWRLCFIAFLVGLMVLILYYGATFGSQNKFQNFMASQTFGIRFMFAAIGVIISFGWGTLFISVAMIVPYQVMSYRPESAADSILLTRPTNPFSGIWSAFKHGQPFPAVIALMGIFSEFMPIILANIPYTITQTEITHKICLWLSTAILGLMVLTITLSFYVEWPHMSVDPRSIAGAMYYVSESSMLDHFDGMASLDSKEREQRVIQIGGRYWYGEMVTQAGVTRPVVERDDGTLQAATRQPVLRVNANPHDIDTAYHGYQPEPSTPSPQQAQGDTMSTQYSRQRDTTSSSSTGHYGNTGFHDYRAEVAAAAAGIQQPETLYDPYQGHQQQRPQRTPSPASPRENQNIS